MSVVHEPLVAEPAEAIARVPEAAIQDAWVRGLFDPTRLVTAEGEKVNVVTRGRLNRDSGPDVIGARIEVGGVLWAGDVEIHLASSAWEAHGHHLDAAYDRVILHVVLSPDKRTGTLRRPDGSALPELVLLPHLDRSLRSLLPLVSTSSRGPRPTARTAGTRSTSIAGGESGSGSSAPSACDLAPSAWPKTTRAVPTSTGY